MGTIQANDSMQNIILSLVAVKAYNDDSLTEEKINPWTRTNFLKDVNNLIDHLFRSEAQRINLNIAQLQQAILIGEGTMKAIKVEKQGWDLTQSPELMNSAHQVSMETNKLFLSLIRGDDESYTNNKQTFIDAWEEFTCCYDNEVQRAKDFFLLLKS